VTEELLQNTVETSPLQRTVQKEMNICCMHCTHTTEFIGAVLNDPAAGLETREDLYQTKQVLCSQVYSLRCRQESSVAMAA